MTDSGDETQEQRKRLDEIATQWSLLRLSHEDSVTRAGPARRALVLRYGSAIRSYVGAMMQDEQQADEVAQEVVVRLLQGDFANASPERGRFRDLLKVSVRNMVRSHWRKEGRRRGVPLEAEQIPEQESDNEQLDARWLALWQKQILGVAYDSLRDYEQRNPGSVAYTVLRLRADHPDASSEELAEQLSQATGRDFNATATRQQLRRARLRFAQVLAEELARGLADPSPERVEEELVDLGLMPYVRDFLPPDWRQRGEMRA